MALLCASVTLGCITPPAPELPKLRPLYEAAPVRYRPSIRKSAENRLTVSAEGLPLGLFARQMAELSGVSIVVEEALEERLVTLEVQDQSVAEILAMVARRLSTQTTRTGNLYFLGQLRTEDRGVLVAKSGHVDRVDLQAVAGLLLSQDGRAHVSKEGVCVVADKVEVLTRVNEAMESLRGLDRDVWVLQLHLLAFDKEEAAKFGITSALRGSAVAGVGSGVTSAAALSLDAALEAAQTSSASSVIAQPLYLVNEGQTVKYQRGAKLPIRESVIGERNVSQTVRYLDVGLRIELSVSALELDQAVLAVTIANERVARYEEDAPVVEGTQYSSHVDIESGGVYLITSYDEVTETVEWWRWLGYGNGSRTKTVVSHVWLRAYRVRRGDTLGAPEQADLVAVRTNRSVSEDGRTRLKFTSPLGGFPVVAPQPTTPPVVDVEALPDVVLETLPDVAPETRQVPAAAAYSFE